MKTVLKRSWKRYRALPPGILVLVWLVLGVGVGLALGEDAAVVAPVGEVFLRLLLMGAVPLVFFNLLDGIARTGGMGTLGSVGVRVLAYYVVTTAFALFFGLVLAHTIEPGAGFELSGETPERMGEVPSLADLLVGLVPSNVFHAFSEGQLAQIVVFAVFCGAATMLLPKAQRDGLHRAYETVAALLRGIVALVLHVAPYGVAALAAETAGRYGAELVGSLGLFVVTVWIGHLCLVAVYLSLLAIFARMGPRAFFKATVPVYATAMSTCSSLATLVVSLEVAKQRLKLPDSIASFTLSLGAQINKDGTSVMLAVILIFTAQAAGQEFTIGEQVTILLTGLLLSEGSGGIPGGGLVVALIFVQAFHLPVEIATVVAGVYRLVDTGSTTVNCMGDLVCATIFGRRGRAALGDASAPDSDARA